jgi:predicted Zn finger-like uncharacterized protein
MPLTTRCRHCGRLFPVYAQQIKARGGKVECPQCGRRFAAIPALLDEQIPPSEIGHGRRAKRTAARNAIPVIPAEAPPPRRRAALRWAIGSLVLAAALALQVAWWERSSWPGGTRLWRVLADACGRLGCELPLPRVAGSIAILRPVLAQQANAPNALRLELTLANSAQVMQRLPLLQLELYDEAGRLLAARRFQPPQYLAAGSSAPGIAPGGTADVRLDIAAPQTLPNGFRVRLF